MTPADKGRFCAACQKTVIDFTSLTNAEILDFLKQPQGSSSCGHFLSSQLGKELLAEKAKPVFISTLAKRMAASLLFFHILIGDVWAQGIKSTHATAQYASNNKRKSIALTRTIKGMALDYNSKTPLHGLEIQVAGTNIKTNTDKAGRFIINLPLSFNDTIVTLQAYYIDTADSRKNGYIILDEKVDRNYDKKVILYRYAVEEAQIIATAYKTQYIIDGGYSIGVGKTEVRHRSLVWGIWQRTRYFFFKKIKPLYD